MNQNRDVLISIFKYLDWISLATSSSVCKSWKDASNYILRNFDTKEWIPYTNSDDIHSTLMRTPDRKRRNRQDEDRSVKRRPFSNKPYVLGPLLGIGGSSRVFQLGNLSNVCIKICSGGRYVLGEGGCNCSDLFDHQGSCKKLDQLVLNSDEAVLQAIYIWASATSEVAMRLCKGHLNGMIRDEFDLLRDSAEKSLSPLKYKLFPQVFQLGVEEDRAFIIMERLDGVFDIPSVISNSFVKEPTAVKTVQVDFLPAILEIIEALLELGKEIKFWHGDLKPENIIVSYKNSKMSLRCIDPLPRTLDEGAVLPVSSIATISYNPKAYLGPSADVFGLALIMYELYTSEQPFMRYERRTWDGEEEKRPLSETLNPWRRKHNMDEFAVWLIDTLQEKTKLGELKDKLERFQKSGKRITRFIPITLFTE